MIFQTVSFLTWFFARVALEPLNELDLDHEADFCEKLHEDAERLYRSLSARLNEQQDGA
ncbi:TPA: Rop family plasmid primer RNA-binding protein [Escherichia coli]|nr:Rop family plasmid primer RNA-binding protein [Escherichia coli]HCG2938406.1 Rop family plasmid primer RNA-binding protein [Escherichia coli]HCG3102035.1 Rop family plasmid primer RNA-binding protein [Escherichia coli]